MKKIDKKKGEKLKLLRFFPTAKAALLVPYFIFHSFQTNKDNCHYPLESVSFCFNITLNQNFCGFVYRGVPPCYSRFI